MTRADLIATAIVWVLVFWQLARTIPRQSTSHQWQVDKGPLWGLLISAGGVCSLRIYELQREIDSILGVDVPVGLWLRSLFTLIAVWSYTLLLRQVNRQSQVVTPPITKAAYPVLFYVPPISLLVAIMLLFLSFSDILPYGRAYYLIMLVSDSTVVVLIAFIFIPLNVAMYRFERVRNMRPKHAATILLCLCYAVSVFYTLRHNLGIVQSGVMDAPMSFPVLALVAAGCFVIQFAPFKVLSVLFIPVDYLKYLKLSHIEKRIAHMANARAVSGQIPTPFQLEQAIYAALISILDNYRDVGDHDEGQHLKQQIEAYIPAYPDYLDLVDKLVRLPL